jgi:hypothetical protein
MPAHVWITNRVNRRDMRRRPSTMIANVTLLKRSVRPSWIAALLCTISIGLFWPGITGFDAVQQYEQVVAGSYNDWHPPVMAHLWSLLYKYHSGPGPMLFLQMALYWAGLGLLSSALWEADQQRASISVLSVGAFPFFLGWQAEVVKDTQMLAAMVAAFGLVARARILSRTINGTTWCIVIVLLGYATLVRSNAAFATVPLAVLLAGSLSWRWRVGFMLVGILFVGLVAGPINHRLLAAKPTGNDRAPLLFDIVGTYANGGSGAGLTPTERNVVNARSCYTPLFWDPIFQPDRCGDALSALRIAPISTLANRWVNAVTNDPISYAKHRIAHLNRTERFAIGPGWAAGPHDRSWMPPRKTAAVPWRSALPEPSSFARRLLRYSGRMSDVPFTWPILWVVTGLFCFRVLSMAPATPDVELALALVVSALALEGSFLVVSIASQIRYHLWSMFATALALVMVISSGRGSRRLWIAWICALIVLSAVGLYSRSIIEPAPRSYRAMLG